MDASPPRPLALAPRLHPRAGPHPSAARRHLTRRILTDDQPRARANPDALDAGRKPLAGACAEALATAHDGKSLKPRGQPPPQPRPQAQSRTLSDRRGGSRLSSSNSAVAATWERRTASPLEGLRLPITTPYREPVRFVPPKA